MTCESNRRVLVTGATGLLGSHVAERLRDKGFSVRALVRPSSRTEFLESLGVELVQGDLNAPEDCAKAVEGIDHVFHSAAKVGDWGRWQAAGAVVDSSYEDYPPEFYDGNLADAPGWKVGGWPPWGRTDPNPRYCAVCEARMVPLLTIASFEWDGGTQSWAPQEDRAAYANSHHAGLSPAQPTRVEVGSADNMQLYVCPTSPEHPHTDLIQ